MSIQAVAWAISQCTGSPTGKGLLICLANYADERGECWPSQKTIARDAELGERATRDWLKKLEEQGLISRRRRHRSDGSRTSDTYILNLAKTSNSAANSLAAESAGRPDLPASDAEPSGTSCRTYRQEVPGNEPSTKPSIEPSSGASARGKDGFKKLWEEWPSKERPDKMKAAKWAFDRLTAEEQRNAVSQAGVFCRISKAQKEIARMITYLKEHQFEDLVNGPEVDTNGMFILTPEREEWQAWREYFRQKHGDASAKRVDAKKFFLTETRWPPELPSVPNEQVGK